MSDADVTPRDALAIAQRALGKANENAKLRERIAELEDEVAKNTLRLSEFDDDRAYADLTRDDKIGLIREHAFEKAAQGSGKAALDYSDIMWEVFDGEPSADHCYTLMEQAASLRGFDVKTPASGNRSLVVDAAAAKDSAVFSSAKKTTPEEVR